jgi:ribosomal protein S18 acetylase RimI-like enzyme
VREFRVGQDEFVVFQVIEDAFNEWPDRSPSTYDDWAPGVIGRGGFEPWQLLVATRPGAHGEEVAGASHLVMSGDEGWVNQIAVHREHRGQGVARALLSRSFGVAREHGATRFGLSTDSRTGALGLYERLGMKVRLSFSHWSRRM